MTERAESKNNVVMDKRLLEEFSMNSDLQIPCTHWALAPKLKAGQAPRSTVLNFQQLTVKEMLLEKKRWRKKQLSSVKTGFNLDHDYLVRMLQQHKAKIRIERIIKNKGICFFRHSSTGLGQRGEKLWQCRGGNQWLVGERLQCRRVGDHYLIVLVNWSFSMSID